nr:MAG TPA: hypothetical protein [Caudoviricetes sp.]
MLASCTFDSQQRYPGCVLYVYHLSSTIRAFHHHGLPFRFRVIYPCRYFKHIYLCYCANIIDIIYINNNTNRFYLYICGIQVIEFLEGR